MNPGLAKPGAALEAQVVAEASSRGQYVLIAHPGNPNAQGVDVVSFDLKTRILHIWEAKDWGSRSVGGKDLTALMNAWGLPTPKQEAKHGREAGSYARERGRAMWTAILDAAPSPAFREAIKDAINSGRVEFHLRGGRDTRFTKGAIEDFIADSPGSKGDVGNYN